MKVRNILGFLGVIPFAISLLYFNLNIGVTGLTGQNIFILYSIAIVSFLSGTLWQVNNNESNTPLISNIFCLLAIFAIFLPLGLGIFWLACGYLLLWYSEYRLSKTNYIKRTREYMALRGKLTIIVVGMHLVALFKVSP